MKQILIICILISTLFLIVNAQTVNVLVKEGKKLVEQGNITFKEPVLLKARGLFERAVSSDSENYLAKYYTSYTDYRLATYHMKNKDNSKFNQFIKSSEKTLRTLISENDEDIESLSLLATVLGIQISLSQELGATFGQEAVFLISKALKIAPKNPRVLLHAGINKLNTPEFFGGSKEKALEYFTQSVTIFEKNNGEEAINWGQLDALAWQGIAYTKFGNNDSAISAFNKALEIEPEYGWVKYVLLPSAEKKLKESLQTITEESNQ
jgi:tetratricopeptide (TPR) repeat protein